MKTDHWFSHTNVTAHTEILPSPSMYVATNGFLR